MKWKRGLVFIGLVLAPFLISDLLARNGDLPLWDKALALTTYWATLGLVYVTWINVEEARVILKEAQTLATATTTQSHATQKMVEAAERDRIERFMPIIVPITDIRTLSVKVAMRSFPGPPIAIKNVGQAAAINIEVVAGFCQSYASQPAQPFKISSLAAGDTIYLGHLTSCGNNPAPFVLTQLDTRIKCQDILGNSYEFECSKGVLKST
jgi:hypothetical protein